jgi:hypothetical protein
MSKKFKIGDSIFIVNGAEHIITSVGEKYAIANHIKINIELMVCVSFPYVDERCFKTKDEYDKFKEKNQMTHRISFEVNPFDCNLTYDQLKRICAILDEKKMKKPIKIKMNNGDIVDGFVCVERVNGDSRDSQPDSIDFQCFDEDDGEIDERDYDVGDVENKIYLNLEGYCV